MKLKEFIKNKKEIIIIGIIFAIAITLRIIYITKTPYYYRQHDLGDLSGAGCLNYIYTIYKTGKLPTTNLHQFYHPPLNHLLSAALLKIVTPLTSSNEPLFEILQILPCIYSILLICAVYKILKELKFNFEIIAIIIFIISIHPTMIILSGSINNDMLSILLIHIVVLRLIKWYKNNNLKNTIILAIVTGASVMAKTSAAIVAPSIAMIFIWKFIEDMKKHKSKNKILKIYISKFATFGIISLSIGLWYPIRNYILFKQPILYVLDPKEMAQYYGYLPFMNRLLPNLESLNSVYHNSYVNAGNIYGAIIKTSLFGEYEFAKTGFLYTLAQISVIFNFFIGIIIPIILIPYFIKSITKTNQNFKWKLSLFLLLFINIISFIIMQNKLPYGCSEDFRYIVPSIFLILTILGYKYQEETKKIKKLLVIHIYTLIIITLLIANLVIFTNI